jgi:hypothetical protein
MRFEGGMGQTQNAGTELRFRAKNTQLRARAVEILGGEKPMTLRALFYRLVSCAALKNTAAEYKRLGRLMVRLREAEEVPITGWLVDRVRSTLKPSSWSGLADYGQTVRDCYRKDLWAQMPHHVEVFVEKDAIAGTVHPVTDQYDVALRIIRGDVSVSFAGEIADFWARIRKPIAAFYLGDFDPAGFGIEEVLRQKLQQYSRRTIISSAQSDPRSVFSDSGAVVWHRLGVNTADFTQFGLISLPVKRTASRAKAFIDRHGTACAEVDAVPPDELRRRVRCAIEAHIDPERWKRLQRVEELERNALGTLLSTWNGA